MTRTEKQRTANKKVSDATYVLRKGRRRKFVKGPDRETIDKAVDEYLESGGTIEYLDAGNPSYTETDLKLG